MSDEQNIKKMGGLYKKIPVTYILMLVGTLSLTGFPFFSAYYSKDLIMELVFLDDSYLSNYVFINSVIVVFLTSFIHSGYYFMFFTEITDLMKRYYHMFMNPPISCCFHLLFLSFFSVFFRISI